MKEMIFSRVLAREGSPMIRLRTLSYLGPFFLAFGFGCAAVSSTPQSAPLLFTGLLGLIFAWKWELRGFIAGTLGFLLLMLWDYMHLPVFPLSMGILYGSMMLSLFIIALAEREIVVLLASSSEEREGFIDRTKELHLLLEEEKAVAYSKLESADEEIESLKRERDAFKRLVEVKKQELERIVLSNQRLIDEARSKGEAIAQLQKDATDHQVRLEELNVARVNEFQLSLLSDIQNDFALRQAREIEVLKTMLEALTVQLKSTAAKPVMSFEETSPEVQYAQLRKQFEEKSAVLHVTRKQLFDVEGKWIAMQKESQEKALDAHPVEKELEYMLKTAVSECRDLELQIEELHQFVTTLIMPKKRKKKICPDASQGVLIKGA